MYSPTTRSLRESDFTATNTVSHSAAPQRQIMLTDTCVLDLDVADYARKTLADAFITDPLSGADKDMCVAIGTPVITTDERDPYHVTCSTDVAYYRIDAARLDERCEEIGFVCDIRPVRGEFRIHPIGDDLAIVDTRHQYNTLAPWLLCSRVADFTMRSDTDMPFMHNTRARAYAALPEVVEDYITAVLHRRVIDARAIVGAIAYGAIPQAPDVLPFELALDDYIAVQDNHRALCAHLDALREKAHGAPICWDHYRCGDGVTYVDPHYGINAAMSLPAPLIAAVASTRTAGALAHRLFDTATSKTAVTKNVVRAVGRTTSLGALGCAMAFITTHTPSDWIAGIISATDTYSHEMGAKHSTSHDPAASMTGATSVMGTYMHLLDRKSYTRMCKPLATGRMSFEEFLHASASRTTNDDTYTALGRDIHAPVTAHPFPPLEAAHSVTHINTVHTRTLGDYMRACADVVDAALHGNTVTTDTAPAATTPTFTFERFMAWTRSPAGMQWQTDNTHATRYIENTRGKVIFAELTRALDGMHIDSINVTMRVARSKNEYIVLGEQLANCIDSYSYQPDQQAIIALYVGRVDTPVAAMEITCAASGDIEVKQIYAKANSKYTHKNTVQRTVEDTLAHIAALYT